MQLAKVIGTATATLKHESLQGAKMAVVLPLLANGGPDGFPLIVVDAVSAGIGELVFITSDGRFSREWLNHEKTPVRYTIVGIKD